MAHLIALTPSIYVSGQVDPSQLASLAAEFGIKRVISNRPDDEEPGQPTAGDMKQAAEAAGMGFLSAPMRGMPTPDTVEQVADFLDHDGKTLLFCRSGMRSTIVWALASASKGADPTSLRQAAFDAGYDLSSLPL